jgi:hypothetical protein
MPDFIADKIVETKENSAGINQRYGSAASDYRTFLFELSDFIKMHSHIKEVEIEHPRLGKIRLSK